MTFKTNNIFSRVVCCLGFRICLILVSGAGLSGCLNQLLPLDDGIVCEAGYNCPDDYFCHLAAGVCKQVSADWSCGRDADCPFGSICEQSLCQAGCRADGDCGLAQACLDGSCSTSAGRCNDTSMCPFGSVCDTQTQTCVVPSQHESLCNGCTFRLCLIQSDCPGSSRCVGATSETFGECDDCPNGSCGNVEVGNACTSNRDCSDDMHCLRNGCFEDSHCPQIGTIPQSCGFDRYDPDGTGHPTSFELQSCKIGQCVKAGCTTACNLNAEEPCPRGFSCFRNIWIPETSECTIDSDCPGTRTCERVNEANDNNYCSCLYNSDCEEGSCVDGVCQVGSTCQPSLGLTCEDV